MFVRFVQLRPKIDMFLVVRGISDLMKMTADDGLRFVRFGPDHGVKSFAPFADVSIAPKEIDRAGAEAQQLRHPSIVVVRLRQMAVGAILGCANAARRVREMWIECLAAVAFG